jgi:lysozyme
MINAAGVHLIKEFEGISLTPYKDQAGKLTVGIGHLVQPYERFTEITEQQAETILLKDLSEAERAVQALTLYDITAPEHANRYAALVSFVFNLGRNAYRGSTLRAHVNARKFAEAADEFPRWRYVTVDGKKIESKGLLRRRMAEKALFIKLTEEE